MRFIALLAASVFCGFGSGCGPTTEHVEVQEGLSPESNQVRSDPDKAGVAALADPKGEVLVEASMELVVSVPVETDLDQPGLRDTREVWLEMVAAARETIDLAHFYASNREEGPLEPVIRAIEAAANRGVTVRFLAEKKFYETYPDTLDRLSEHASIEVRHLDLSGITGGVLHAKYMLVDEGDVFVGSANFDWRSLKHIQELGLRLRSSEVSEAFRQVFQFDWQLAAGASNLTLPTTLPTAIPVRFGSSRELVRVRPIFSPEKLLGDADSWDLPHLVSRIEAARKRVFVQLLTYKATDRSGQAFLTLETALRKAASRGVDVRLLLADWCKREGTIEGLQALQTVPNINVKMVTIPQATSGFIPFARVVHAKYMVADAESAWVGTSNWSGDYFSASRNAGVLVDGSAFGLALEGFFLRNWDSRYAYLVDPDARYDPPAVGEPPVAIKSPAPDKPAMPAKAPTPPTPPTPAKAAPIAEDSSIGKDGKWPPPPVLYEITKVVDGDTIYVLRGGEVEKLRLLSVDTEEKSSGKSINGQATTKPETHYGQATMEWAQEYFAALSRDGEPARVGLRFPAGGESRGVYGRLLCHVVLPDGTDFNLLLVREGRSPYFNKYGNSMICHEAFVQAQKAARASRLGVWDPMTNTEQGEGAATQRPYEKLMPWWTSRAAAIDLFRARRAKSPERFVAADSKSDLQAAVGSGVEVEVFGGIDRIFKEKDGSLTVLLWTSNRREALRVVVPENMRPAVEDLGLGNTKKEFRQNYVYVTGTITREPRGFYLRDASADRWRISKPAYDGGR